MAFNTASTALLNKIREWNANLKNKTDAEILKTKNFELSVVTDLVQEAMDRIKDPFGDIDVLKEAIRDLEAAKKEAYEEIGSLKQEIRRLETLIGNK